MNNGEEVRDRLEEAIQEAWTVEEDGSFRSDVEIANHLIKKFVITPRFKKVGDEVMDLASVFADKLWIADYVPGIGDKGYYACDPRDVALLILAAGYRKDEGEHS